MDPTLTDTVTSTNSSVPTMPSADHEHCLTLDVTTFLLGRVSMNEVCQFCVLDALSPLNPTQMSIYAVGSDSLFRLLGSFGRGPGQDVLHRYSCLDDAHVGEQLRGGHPLANFPLLGMRPEQHLNISDLHDGPQVLWPLSAVGCLVGVMHVRFSQPPEARTVSAALGAIAGPISLAIDHVAATSNGVSTKPMIDLADSLTDGLPSLRHPSLMDRVPPPPRLLSTVSEVGSATDTPLREQLTPRQLRVLTLMAKGMTNGQIARVLAFSESTVRQETMAIYRILQVKGRSEAVEQGRLLGIIPPASPA